MATIASCKEYAEAARKVWELLESGVKRDTPDGKELDRLVHAVIAYEEEHFNWEESK